MKRRDFISMTSAPLLLTTKTAVAQSGSLRPRFGERVQSLIDSAMNSDTAWEKMLYLCDRIGARLSGSASLQRAIEWTRSTLENEQYDRVWLQPVQVPHWVRGNESAELIEPHNKNIEILALGRSIGTLPEGLVAPVLVVSSFDELRELPDAQVRNRIVVWNVPFTTYGETVQYRSRGHIEAARKGAVASLVRSVGPNSLNTPHTGVMSRYEDGLTAIPSSAIPIEDAELMARLQARGVRMHVRLNMEALTLPDAESFNVIAEIEGRENPEEIVVFGGHLDSWDVGQGAHDDAGGCMTTMDALRIIKESGLRPRRTLRLVLWTNEENGSAGANAYREWVGADIDKHVAAFESDVGVEPLLGFGVTVRARGSFSDDGSRQARAMNLLHGVSPMLQPLDSQRVYPSGGGVDIAPLMAAGVPGFSIRTTMDLYWDIHHTRADTVDKVNEEDIRKHTASIAALMYVLAENETLMG